MVRIMSSQGQESRLFHMVRKYNEREVTGVRIDTM